MKHILMVMAMAVLVFGFAQIARADDDSGDSLKEIESVMEEIHIRNLYNGLNLTPEQITQLIAIAEETQSVREEYARKGEAMKDDYKKALLALTEELKKGPFVSQEVENKATTLKDKAKELGEQMKEEIQKVMAKSLEVLTDAQKQVLDDFKPCMAPPKNQKNPVRAGQASGNDHAIKLLKKVREASEPVFDSRKSELVRKCLEKYEQHHGKFTEAEKTSETVRLTALFEKVRAMDAEEFEMEKENIAAEAKIKDRAEELQEELSELSAVRRSVDPEMMRKARFFTSKCALEVLKERLEYASDFQQGDPKNLGELPSAGCKDGKCAIDKK
ncbi:MAG: Spy/CpxP family protein refolding chaperone [Planctomycetes bacterium]|nr:Spy/CpxP family protein refolding chaperone [Planctomycetota bacterium]